MERLNMDITLDDVETAIKVLNEFIRRSREAQYTIKKFEVTTIGSTRMPTSLQDFMNLAYQSRTQKRETEEPTTEPEPLTDEDMTRMREIRDKIKRKA